MPLTEEQHDWIVTAQAKSAEYQVHGEKMAARNKEMLKITAEVDRLTDELREANKALKITWDSDAGKSFFKKKKRSMDWMDGDRDSEVDTVHDLKDGYQVDEKAARRVLLLHEELVRLQTQMEEAEIEVDDPEKPGQKKTEKVFSAKDIERELWSPLVMAEVIPSNAVADKYSQEAQVWNGACEIYHDLLEDHTKNTSEHEGLKRGLRIGMDVVSLVGTIGAESIKIANFDALAMTSAEKELAKAAHGIDPSARTPEQTAAMEKLQKFANAERDMAALSVATTVVNGGLTIIDKALDKPEPQLGWKIAEAVFDALQSAASASMGLAGKQVAAQDRAMAESSSFKTAMASATSLVNYGFKAGKVVFRVNDICNAADAGGRKAAAAALIKSVAGAVGDAFAAFDTQPGKDKEGNDVAGSGGAWAKIGGAVQMAIVGASNAGFIGEHIYKSVQSGGLKNPGALVGAIGLTVIGPIMAGVFDQLSDASRKDIGDKEHSKGVSKAFEERDDGKVYNRQSGETLVSQSDTLSGAMNLLNTSGQDEEAQREMGEAVDKEVLKQQIEAALKNMPDLSKIGSELLKSVPSGASAEDAKIAIARRLAAIEQEQKEKEIGDFKNKLATDSQFKNKFFAEIKTQSDKEAEKLDELIGEASGSPEDLEDEEKARKAMASVDKLIREAAACNQKWQMVESLTSGGASILVAALPVAGLVAALQKLAMDTAILVRKSVQLNKWMDNMALTMGNHSVYGPAISSRLSSAKIQVSQQALRVVYDAIGVAAEGAKLADCTGAATGMSIGISMARALTEFGFKMAKEAEVEAGWQLYKDARANPGDRKKARKAMRWNSTLSKCVLAYGIVMDGDPIAKEVGRSCGLTPEVLADQKDVCGKVVSYFNTLYSDDPQVLRRIPLKKDWHPGAPLLTLDSWLRFKAAAAERAVPTLAPESAKTVDIDRFLAVLGSLIGRDGNYASVRDAKYPELNPDPTGPDKRLDPAYRDFLTRTQEAGNGLLNALRAWKPVTGTPAQDAKVKWVPGSSHDGMIDVADSLIAQTQLLLGEVGMDIKALDEREKRKKEREAEEKEKAKKVLEGV